MKPVIILVIYFIGFIIVGIIQLIHWLLTEEKPNKQYTTIFQYTVKEDNALLEILFESFLWPIVVCVFLFYGIGYCILYLTIDIVPKKLYKLKNIIQNKKN